MILFRGAQLFAPESLGRQDLLVAGDQIAAIGQLPDPPTGWPCEVVDASDLWLLPGLIDNHTHLGGGGGEGGASTRVPPLVLSQLTLAGVTTAIGLLGTDSTTRTHADLLAVARGLSHYGLTALCYTGSYEVPPITLTGSVRGDLVHIERMVAVGEIAISDHRSSQPTLDEILRLAADAHVSGLMTGKAGLLHLHLGDGRRGLDLVRKALEVSELPPRVFHPTHLNRNRRLFAEALAASALGITLDFTAFPADDDSFSAGESLTRYLAAGLDPLRVTLSSDGGGCLPTFDSDGRLTHMDVGTSAALLQALAEATAQGVDRSAAIAAVTRNPARLFRLEDRGRLQVGLRADLALLRPDWSVWGTLAGGRWLVRQGQAVLRGPFEPLPR